MNRYYVQYSYIIWGSGGFCRKTKIDIIDAEREEDVAFKLKDSLPYLYILDIRIASSEDIEAVNKQNKLLKLNGLLGFEAGIE